MMHNLNQFLAGAICFGYAVIALLFFRFAQKTRDRLFGWFFVAFLALAAEQAIGFGSAAMHDQPFVYVTRLVAFTLIIVGVIDRNRRRTP